MKKKIQRSAKIVNSRGLHARAAAKLCKIAELYDAEISVAKGDLEVSSRSIMGMLMLAATYNSEILLSASGTEAREAVDVICKLIADKFDEE
ncbi:MAG: HPr family phosphocarrier protein [Rhodospirillaceae bacterium]